MPANISWRKMVKKFRKMGFVGPCSGSKHSFMIKDDLKVRIPSDHGSDISVGLIYEILSQAGINKKIWDKA
ncbi:type II toxin-antitoxin system HicA family toxin [Candidatus Parcubacteria bacterium]|nr:type II toxin-antitoxin system HicA family toxin [Candidatus Parcubacteria bacterium]